MKKRLWAAIIAVSIFYCCVISVSATEVNTASELASDNAFTLGETKDNAYENSYFNLRIPILKGMKFDSADEVARLNGQLADLASSDTAKQLITDGRTVIVAGASDNKSTLLNISINNVGSKIIKQYGEQSLLAGDTKTIASEYEKMGYTSVSVSVDTITFLGEDHPSLLVTGNIMGRPFYERQVCVIKGDYIAVVTVSGQSENAFSIISQATKLFI